MSLTMPEAGWERVENCTDAFAEAVHYKRFNHAGVECVLMHVVRPQSYLPSFFYFSDEYAEVVDYFTGYVNVPKNSPAFGARYGHKEMPEVLENACGEITYTEDHLPFSEKGDGWWIGFDTAHPWDESTEESATETLKHLAEALSRLQ